MLYFLGDESRSLPNDSIELVDVSINFIKAEERHTIIFNEIKCIKIKLVTNFNLDIIVK